MFKVGFKPKTLVTLEETRVILSKRSWVTQYTRNEVKTLSFSIIRF